MNNQKGFDNSRFEGALILKAILLLPMLTGIVSAAHAQTWQQLNTEIAQRVVNVSYKANGERYSSRQSMFPGEDRYCSSYDIEVVWDPAGQRAYEAWDLVVSFPLAANFSFKLTYNDRAGLKEGQDSFVVDDYSIGSTRLGANFKDLWLTNPLLLAAHAETTSSGVTTISGKSYAQYRLLLEDTEFTLLVDSETGLPAVTTSVEYDPLYANLENKVVFSNWTEVSGIPFPLQIEQYQAGKLLRREIRTDVTINRQDADEIFAFDSASAPALDEELYRTGWEMSHLILVRVGLGAPIFDQPKYDDIEFLEVSPDIYQVGGSRHHSLVVVGDEGIAIVDAPYYPMRSENVLEQIRQRWPDKPVRYMIMSHHHVDHSGGMMTYIDTGATLVTHRANTAFFEDALRRNGINSHPIISVEETTELDGIGRRIGLYNVINTHSDGMLAAYFPDSKLLFNADLFSPGRELQFQNLIADLYSSIRYHGLDVEIHTAGHGHGAGGAVDIPMKDNRLFQQSMGF